MLFDFFAQATQPAPVMPPWMTGFGIACTFIGTVMGLVGAKTFAHVFPIVARFFDNPKRLKRQDSQDELGVFGTCAFDSERGHKLEEAIRDTLAAVRDTTKSVMTLSTTTTALAEAVNTVATNQKIDYLVRQRLAEERRQKS